MAARLSYDQSVLTAWDIMKSRLAATVLMLVAGGFTTGWLRSQYETWIMSKQVA